MHGPATIYVRKLLFVAWDRPGRFRSMKERTICSIPEGSVYPRGKRAHDDGTKRIRYPFTDDILLHVVREMNNDEEGVISFCVAFAVFPRPGDFTWDTWSPSSC
jgi:hypothetical protein